MIHFTTLRLRFGITNFSSLLGWFRGSFSLEHPALLQYALRVFEAYGLRGAEDAAAAAGLFVGVSCPIVCHKAMRPGYLWIFKLHHYHTPAWIDSAVTI